MASSISELLTGALREYGDPEGYGSRGREQLFLHLRELAARRLRRSNREHIEDVACDAYVRVLHDCAELINASGEETPDLAQLIAAKSTPNRQLDAAAFVRLRVGWAVAAFLQSKSARARELQQATASAEPQQPGCSIEELLDRRALLKLLDPEDLELLLFAVQHEDHREAAKAAGLTPSAFRQRTSRLRRRLKEALP